MILHCCNFCLRAYTWDTDMSFWWRGLRSPQLSFSGRGRCERKTFRTSRPGSSAGTLRDSWVIRKQPLLQHAWWNATKRLLSCRKKRCLFKKKKKAFRVKRLTEFMFARGFCIFLTKKWCCWSWVSMFPGSQANAEIRWEKNAGGQRNEGVGATSGRRAQELQDSSREAAKNEAKYRWAFTSLPSFVSSTPFLSDADAIFTLHISQCERSLSKIENSSVWHSRRPTLSSPRNFKSSRKFTRSNHFLTFKWGLLMTQRWGRKRDRSSLT